VGNPSESTGFGQKISHIIHYSRLTAAYTQLGKNLLQPQNRVASADNVDRHPRQFARDIVRFRDNEHETPKREISCSIVRRKCSKKKKTDSNHIKFCRGSVGFPIPYRSVKERHTGQGLTAAIH
jgi:hypothetical protein